MDNILFYWIKSVFMFFFVVFSVSASNVETNPWTKPALKYPIVMVHGFMGFSSFMGNEYFVGIPQELAKVNARVFTAEVSGMNSYEVRGEQLLAQVETILALTGARKVHLIGHSQGALTSRYVAAMIPESIASVTSVGGVNRGTPIADLVQKAVGEGTWRENLVNQIVYKIYTLFNRAWGRAEYPQSPKDAMKTLMVTGVKKFNERYPEGMGSFACGQGDTSAQGTYYFSWAGITQLSNQQTITDYLFGLLSFLVKGDNDGIVGRCSSHLGHVIADRLSLHHLDLINIHPGTYGKTDPVDFYREHVDRLIALGL